MIVLVPTQLQSYTGGRSKVEATGASVDEVLYDLDARYPGLRFRVIDEQDRIREHVRIFVAGETVENVAQVLSATDEVQIVGALSGG
ncbi:MAG: MoaD/ThiS family protein [Pseudomonadota bacterium]